MTSSFAAAGAAAVPPVPPAPGQPRAANRLPLLRPRRGRWLGGVCLGVAAHLGLPVRLVRLTFFALALAGGVGVALYVFLWVTVPTGDPALEAAKDRPVELQRLAPRARVDLSRVPIKDIGIGLLALAAAGLLIASKLGVKVQLSWMLPTFILLVGLALAWSQLDRTERERWLNQAGGHTPFSVIRLLGGMVLSGAGVLLLVSQGGGVSELVQGAVAALSVLAGVALVLAPWWLRLVRELTDERAAREREAERADIAAHLHDSVLQTLALIRKEADNPEEVARMARAQERELREWLYDDRSAPGTSLASELRAVVAEVEDHHAVVIETVVVGDRVPDDDTVALVLAAREALLNAARHGREPITLYLEVGASAVEVFVRDRGDGFELDDVASDRFGVRESILGRVRRRGGTAEVVSSPESGTEVRLRVPVREQIEGEPL